MSGEEVKRSKNPNELELVFIHLFSQKKHAFVERPTNLEMQNLAYLVDKISSKALQTVYLFDTDIVNVYRKRRLGIITPIQKTFEDSFFGAIKRHYDLHSKYIRKNEKLNYYVADIVVEFEIEAFVYGEYKKFVTKAPRSYSSVYIKDRQLLSILKLFKSYEYRFIGNLVAQSSLEEYERKEKKKIKHSGIKFTLHTKISKFSNQGTPAGNLDIFTEAEFWWPKDLMVF